MAKGLQLLLAGVLLGLMGVFAVIGVKSVLEDRAATPSQQQPALVQGQEQSAGTAPQTDTSMTMADQATQQATNNTQLTPAQDQQAQQSTSSATPQPTQAPQQQSAADSSANPANATAASNTDSGAQDSAPQQNAENTGATAQQTTDAAQPVSATQSTEEEKKLDMQLIDEYGGLQLTLSDPASSGKPARGQFIIRDAQDQIVADMKDTDTASFDLSPGIYEVTVIARGKKSARMVNIVTGEFVTELFELPPQLAQAGQNTDAQGGVGAGQQQIQQEQQQQLQQAQQQSQTPVKAGFGKLSVSVQAAGSRAPLKSNIYVQLPNGKHITKKNYVDFGAFELRPGTYKVTVKAQGKTDVVRNIGIKENDNIQQVFLMETPGAKAANKPEPAPEGTLSMTLQAPQGQNNRGRFIIQDNKGQRVTRMRGVSNADIKLKPGRYNVVAVYRGARLTKPVDVFQNKTSRIAFNVNEFPQQAPAQQAQNQSAQQQQQAQQQVEIPAQQGVLQLIAVSGVNRQPLKVNFSVSTLNGRRLKAANNVSVTEVSLPPQDVLVDIAYEEMRGQERIRVKAGEPTVYTFTITPNNNAAAPAPIDQMQQQAPQSMEEMLMERLQQEVLQRLSN